MKNYYKLAIKGIVLLTMLGFNLFFGKISAQESIEDLDRPNVPLDDQVKFIGELESRSSDRWDFTIGQGTLSENTYQLQKFQSRSDIQFVEQDKPKWTNTGQAPKYAILVTIYEFDPN